ncbi:MAG: flagellar biosynthetic protein FliO [Nitrospina sp.]|jgi:flagellar biosynthetic protein FliO|nr:flagellar biosynthetic protein FliO [Nitrospina sp.]MBT6718018.1 flagellar biosynthetic protein FliO [Nitrospina sp.]
MKRFLKALTFIPLFLLLTSNFAGASILSKQSGKWSALNGLKKVHSHLMSNGHIVRLEFNKPVSDWVEPVFYERSVQIDFPGAFIDPSKKSFPAESSSISNVFASQFDGETLRIRFQTKPDATGIEKRFKLVSQGRFIVVRFDTASAEPSSVVSKNVPSEENRNADLGVMDDDALSQFLSRASTKMKEKEETLLPKSDANSFSSTVKESPVKESEIKVKRAGMGMAPLVDQIKKAALSDSGTEKNNGPKKDSKGKVTTKENTGFSLKDSRPTGKPIEIVPSGLKMISMFALVLGLMFLIFFGFKKYVLKNTAFGGGNKLVNVLGTWFLGPKKNIALVEVAGEVLVLGISQDNITLLSSITSEEKIEEIKNAGGKGTSGLNFNSDRADSGKDRSRSVTAQAAGQFSNYLSKFSKPQGAKEQVVADAKEQILQKIGKLKTARA